MINEFDDSFYIRLLNFLEEKHYLGAGFHWGSDTYQSFHQSNVPQKYSWWIEDRDLGGTFLTLGELVEDVLSRFLNVGSQDSSKSVFYYINLE